MGLLKLSQLKSFGPTLGVGLGRPSKSAWGHANSALRPCVLALGAGPWLTLVKLRLNLDSKV
jgi:hypothetical protein